MSLADPSNSGRAAVKLLAVVENLQQRIRQFLVAAVGIDEDMAAALERHRLGRRFRLVRA